VIHIQTFVGEEIRPLQKQLAELRITVFKDFPYLYEGSFEYEAQYLERYMRSQKAAVIAVFDGTNETNNTNMKLVGAATTLPLTDEESYIQEPFKTNGFALESIYYFGESLLLSKYRGQGLGHKFFDAREQHAKLDPKCKITSFCAVDRAADHQLKPAHYRPLDEFWQARGYKKNSNLKASFSWQDIGDIQETKKSMTFWWREL
jgi:GNAT superfamily N-acetyltransferase